MTRVSSSGLYMCGENVKRIMLTVAYDGTYYHGWQYQNNGKTIEGELNKALSKLLQTEVEVIGASRTDAGVHALCNVAVFDSGAAIPAEKYAYALNQMLPIDIRIRNSREVPMDFHPRKTETVKTYEYRIDCEEFADPLKTRYAYFTYVPLDEKKMQEAAFYLVGTHDFKSFCSVNTTATTTVRTIFDIQVIREGADIMVRITGNGFLYNMVRIIVGTLMDVGRGRYEPEMVKRILEKKDRCAAGPTVPACGLLLKELHFLQLESTIN